MGDKNRNVEFDKFLKKQFPNVKSVLVIADGDGELSTLLANRMNVRVIEAKPRQSKKHARIKYTKGWFTSDCEIEEELIVGMHPDEATGEILLAAKQQNKPCAVVPCCSVGKYAENKMTYRDWINKLTSIFHCNQYVLPIKGKNIALFVRKWTNG